MATHTADERAAEKQAQKDRAWDLWLDCAPQSDIATSIGVEQQTISNWIQKIRESGNFIDPPQSRQHFDIWQFQTAS